MALSRPVTQRGVAALMAVLFLLFMLSVVLVIAHQMAATDVYDSGAQNNSVEALFLAESGVERTAQRLTGTACISLGTEGPVSLGNGSFSVVTPAPYLDTGLCRVRVSGTVGRVTRTLDAWLSSPSGGTITTDTLPQTTTVGSGSSRTLSYTVPADASILLVGLSFNNASVTATVKYGTTDMTLGPSAAGASPWPRAQIWYLVNPPAGTANVVASFSSSVETIMGARWFSGVNTGTATAPWDVAEVVNNANGKATTITITPVTSGAWIFEVAAMAANDVTTMGALTNRTSRWNTNSNGNVRGAASTIGPVSTTQTPTWRWPTGNNNKWSQAAVALQPGGGSVSVRKWSEVVN